MTASPKKIVVGVLLLICIAGLVFVVRSRQESVPASQEAADQVKTKGPSRAPITIVEFSDFQCPSCAASQKPLKALLNQFPNVIQLHFKHFPLGMHTMALAAAKHAECAARQNKFWDYQDLIFENQPVWSRDPDPGALFLAYANAVKLDMKSLQSCLEDPEIQKSIDKDKLMGEQNKVGSTPTFFINGERLVGSKQLEEEGPALIKKQLESLVQKKS